MINVIQNSIGALAKRLGIVKTNLQLWLGFTKADWVSGELVVLDKSTNTNNAKLFTGKALEFNGNDKVDLGTTFGLTGEFTVAFWVNLTNYTQAVIVGDSANEDWFRINSATQYTLKINNSSSINIVSGGSIPLSSWSRIALIRDSNNLVTLSINGIIYTNNAPTKSGDFDFTLIGSKSGTFINGLLSNVQIYNKAWVSDDAAFDYANPNNLVFNNSASSIALSNLKGYYALSEGSGSIAYDSSGEGNNGAITGATYDDKQPTIPQLGMVDWSKGSNLIEFSEDFANAAWTKRGFGIISTTESSPVSGLYATKITENDTDGNPALYYTPKLSNGNPQSFGVWLKASSNITIALSTQGDAKTSDVNVTTSWAFFEVSDSSNGTSGPHIGGYSTITRGSGISIWVAFTQFESEATLGSYIGTSGSSASNATLIQNPNDIGKDLLGNSLRLREGGFNLDGIGYAEVASNSSLTNITGGTIQFWLKTSDTKFSVLNGQSSSEFIGKTDNGVWSFGNAGTITSYIGSDTASTQPLYNNAWNFYTFTGVNLSTWNEFYTSNLAGFDIDGIIDEVLIYSSVLSAKEIKNNYKIGLSKHS